MITIQERGDTNTRAALSKEMFTAQFSLHERRLALFLPLLDEHHSYRPLYHELVRLLHRRVSLLRRTLSQRVPESDLDPLLTMFQIRVQRAPRAEVSQ